MPGADDIFSKRVQESASEAREKFSNYFEQGDQRPTSLAESDTPQSVTGQVQDNFAGEDFDDQVEAQERSVMEHETSVIDRAHDMLSKAFGGSHG